jgi:hypothetical protein
MPRRSLVEAAAMSDQDQPGFQEGDPVWVMQADGSGREGIYVGEGETSTWFGGAPTAYVVYPDTKSGEAVEVDRITPREGERIKPPEA